MWPIGGQHKAIIGVLAWLSLFWLAMTWAATPSRTVLVMGDSLSAAYGLAREQGWVALLDARLAEEHAGWQVINASLSGETTVGGAARLSQALQEHHPAVVLIELGANDALRGLPLEQAQANLQSMIEASRAAGAKILLVGVQIPPNYGPDYTAALQSMYQDLATRNELPLLPFLLAPIASDLNNFQADGLHPIAAAQPAIRDHVWPALLPLLKTDYRDESN